MTGKFICVVYDYSRNEGISWPQWSLKYGDDYIMRININQCEEALCGTAIDLWIFRDGLTWDNITDAQRQIIYGCSRVGQPPNIVSL